jgi:hypothetical protein
MKIQHWLPILGAVPLGLAARAVPLTVAAMGTAAVLSSCDDGAEEVGEDIDEAIEEVEDEIDDATDE